jgi:hypothetical protein
METCDEMEVQLAECFSSALDGSEQFASLSGVFKPRKRIPLPVGQESDQAPETVCSLWGIKPSSAVLKPMEKISSLDPHLLEIFSAF